MSWQLESKKHFVKVTYQSARDERTHSQEYTPGKYSSTIQLFLDKEDTRLIVVPYVLEVLYHDVNIQSPNGTVNRLLAGIRDDEWFSFIARLWTSRQFGDPRIEQYFFHKDQPSGFNIGMISGPGWPLNRGVILGREEIPYIQALREERPGITRMTGTP